MKRLLGLLLVAMSLTGCGGSSSTSSPVRVPEVKTIVLSSIILSASTTEICSVTLDRPAPDGGIYVQAVSTPTPASGIPPITLLPIGSDPLAKIEAGQATGNFILRVSPDSTPGDYQLAVKTVVNGVATKDSPGVAVTIAASN